MLKRLLHLLPCLVAGSCALSAGPVFYTSLASFTTAVGAAPASFGFNSIISGSSGANYNTASGLTVDGFQFVGTNGNGGYYLGAEGPDYVTVDYDRGTGSSIQGPALTSAFYDISDGQLTITMPSGGVTAFGLQLWDVLAGDYSGAGTDTVVLTANGLSGSVVTPPFSGTAFIGFTSSTPVTSVTLTGTAFEEFPTISQVYYSTGASAGTAPEPGTFALMAIPALALFLRLGKPRTPARRARS
ncbi:MAG: hypothetical protein ABSH45_04950 [Bryobacteraceae bacterium]|jgi:hypothetical protein